VTLRTLLLDLESQNSTQLPRKILLCHTFIPRQNKEPWKAPIIATTGCRDGPRSPGTGQGHPVRIEMSSSHAVSISGSSASIQHLGGHEQQNKTDVVFSLSITTTYNLFEFELNF